MVAFLGPEGTFTAEAARRVAGDHARRPLASIAEVFEAVRTGAVALGVVPLENSIEGSVNATLDELAFGPQGCFVQAELLLDVSMNLLARPGVTLADVATVASHPQGLAQCRKWLVTNVPGAKLVAATSTAEAARQAAELEHASDGFAAIGTVLAAERYGLEVLAGDIHDYEGNATRFGVLGHSLPPSTGADKTSLVVFFGEDRPGLLLRILDEFALRGINLTKIESRPAKTTLGEYCIFIDCEGHPEDARVGEALRSVHRHVAELRVLGAYPRIDAVPPHLAPTDTQEAYREAEAWHRRLLGHVDGN